MKIAKEVKKMIDEGGCTDCNFPLQKCIDKGECHGHGEKEEDNGEKSV